MDSKGQIKKVLLSHTKANIKQRIQNAEEVWTLDQTGSKQGLIVSGQTTTTSMLAKSTEGIGMMEHSTKETFEQLTLIPYQTTASSVRDFLARISALLEDGQDSKELEAHYSLRYAECYRLRDLAMCSLKTSRGYSLPTMDEHLESSSPAWMNWGMTVNGKCLIARTSESHRTGRGCSLSDILEDSPDSKYFLSERQTKWAKQALGRMQLIPTSGKEPGGIADGQ